MFVRVDGELRIEVRNQVGVVVDILRGQNDLFGWGITTDQQLDEYANEKVKFAYLFNPWFTVSVAGKSIKDLTTTHNLFEAVEVGVNYLLGK